VCCRAKFCQFTRGTRSDDFSVNDGADDRGYTRSIPWDETNKHQGDPHVSDLKTEFDNAVNYIQTAEGDFKPSNELKLEFYALYKQATEGDVSGKRPGMMDFVGRAKYDAWEQVKGMSSEQAMQQYIDKLESLK
jgi:acyl-CoA-binding protein